MDQQRGGRQPIIAVTERAVLILRGDNVGDELAQAVEHKILPKSMQPRGARLLPALYEQETQPAQRASVPRAALRFGNIGGGVMAGTSPGMTGSVARIRLHAVIASVAKQSRIFPQTQSGLLRRKGSSQ
ncbi:MULTISPECIES: hypothetical protein [Bradyrhizobium]|uniref:hypothetical protein n=1 Tax=Bradyrhizobium TaxID=374 RepID=UPI0013E8BD9F|nr:MULTISPECIES: hypothetical protein [Bradyrhizobium]